MLPTLRSIGTQLENMTDRMDTDTLGAELSLHWEEPLKVIRQEKILLIWTIMGAANIRRGCTDYSQNYAERNVEDTL